MWGMIQKRSFDQAAVASCCSAAITKKPHYYCPYKLSVAILQCSRFCLQIKEFELFGSCLFATRGVLEKDFINFLA